LPRTIVALAAFVTAPSVSPAFWIVVVATACVRLTTLGTIRFAGPSETASAIADPGGTLVPAGGDWLRMMPAATVLLFSWVTAPTVRPAARMVVVAAAWLAPTTFGTSAP